jgi:hypothetical protein
MLSPHSLFGSEYSMASEVSICNLALSHIGASANISSLSEQSEEAYHANLLYAETRDAVLRAHPWAFAARYKSLSTIGTAPGNWSYQYAYPNDCLKVRSILQTRNTSAPIPYELGLADAYNARVILTDQAEAVLFYTYQVVNPLAFDENFVQALSWRLAAELAMPLTRDENRMKAAYQMYQAVLAEALQINANEAHLHNLLDAEWISGRA